MNTSKLKASLWLVPFLLLSLVTVSLGQSAPKLINYQGRLLGPGGTAPPDGAQVDFTFSFYDAASGGSLFLSVLQPNVVVNGGVYNILIGSGTVIPGTESDLGALFQNHGEVWMGVKIGAEAEMTPRVRITSVPYALSVDSGMLGAFSYALDWDGDGYFKSPRPGAPFQTSDLQGIWMNHLLLASTTLPGWAHFKFTIDASGNATCSEFADSGLGSSCTNIGSPQITISSDGIVTIASLPSWHGVMNTEKTGIMYTMTDGGGSYNLGSMTKMGGEAVDCNDGNASVYPGAVELCDGIDNQCPGDPGYGQIDEDCPSGDQLVRDGVDQLLIGSDDFAALSVQFASALAQDPQNPNVAFFKATTDLLAHLHESALGEGSTVCDLQDLYTRSGYHNAAADPESFWDFDLQPDYRPFSCLGVGDGCTVLTGCSVVNDHHNYLVCHDASSTWDDALNFCRSLGADLVAINSPEEDTMIYEHLRAGDTIALMSWIGGHNVPPYFSFIWSNGEHMDYENWVYGWPSYFAGDSCVSFSDYSSFYGNTVDEWWGWENQGCSANLPFVCEEQIDRSQGDVKDSTPNACEWNAYMDNCLIPSLEDYLAALNTVSSDFDYALMNVDSGGPFFDQDPSDDTGYYWIDYGDVSMLKSAVSVSLAGLKIADAYNCADFDLNDLDEGLGNTVDEIGLIETQYPNLGRLQKPARLLEARDHLIAAEQYYEQASAVILAEDTAQSENGLLTVGRYSEFYGLSVEPDDPDGFSFDRYWKGFDSDEQRSRFLADEPGLRTWLQGIVASFSTDTNYSFDEFPGGITDPNRAAVINFYKFFAGVDPRDTYLKTITNPLDGMTAVGVTDLSQLNDANMLTFHQVVLQINGVAPAIGDLSWRNCLLRIDAPAVDTKTIDGFSTDWSGADSDLISTPPVAALDEFPRPDLGDVYVAKDGANLYFLWTRNLTEFVTSSFTVSSDEFTEVEVSWDYWDEVYWGMGYREDYPTAPPTVSYQPGGATEIAVPLSNFGSAQWVRIEVQERPDLRNYQRGGIYVRIQ